jgi:hypothetical protein
VRKSKNRHEDASSFGITQKATSRKTMIIRHKSPDECARSGKSYWFVDGIAISSNHVLLAFYSPEFSTGKTAYRNVLTGPVTSASNDGTHSKY